MQLSCVRVTHGTVQNSGGGLAHDSVLKVCGKLFRVDRSLISLLAVASQFYFRRPRASPRRWDVTGLLNYDNSVPALLAFLAARGGNGSWFGPRKYAGRDSRKQASEKGLTL